MSLTQNLELAQYMNDPTYVGLTVYFLQLNEYLTILIENCSIKSNLSLIKTT